MRLLSTFLCLCSLAYSQDVTVTASVDSQSVSLGDWIRYSVEVKHPASVAVTFPLQKDTIGSFDIVQQDSLIRSEQNGTTELKKNFVIAKYEAGNFTIQPFRVQYAGTDGKMVTAVSNPIPVEIRSVEIDTTQSIRDVKPPMTVPMSAEEIAMYVGIVLALAGLGYGLYYYMKKRKLAAGEIEEEAKPDIPPHVLALLQLDELEAKRLWQAGEIKAYYSEATEIIRRYFELRYGIMALEMTSAEVMSQLDKFKMEKMTFSDIETLLTGSDLVKFAKYQPVASENEQVIPQARSIVERTKPVNEPASAV
ncbi:MAG: BatD family protein [Bacteroidota bacterium]